VKIWKKGGVERWTSLVERWACTKTLKDQARAVRMVVFSPNGEMFATGEIGDDRTINVYSVANDFSRMHSLEGQRHVFSLTFSPNSNRLVSGSYEGSIRLWNPTAGTLLKTVKNAHRRTVNSLVFSSNGNLIASGSADGAIKIWDAKTLKLKFAINDAHSAGVSDLSFTPKGPFLLSASYDRATKVIQIALLDSYVKRSPVLLAYLRFSEIVNSSSGSEVQKFKKARAAYATKFAGGVLYCGLIGGGPKGILGVILSYL